MQPQISCFKFDDDLQKQPLNVNDNSENNFITNNFNNTNKRIRLLNFNMNSEYKTEPVADSTETAILPNFPTESKDLDQ